MKFKLWHDLQGGLNRVIMKLKMPKTRHNSLVSTAIPIAINRTIVVLYMVNRFLSNYILRLELLIMQVHMYLKLAVLAFMTLK